MMTAIFSVLVDGMITTIRLQTISEAFWMAMWF